MTLTKDMKQIDLKERMILFSEWRETSELKLLEELQSSMISRINLILPNPWVMKLLKTFGTLQLD